MDLQRQVAECLGYKYQLWETIDVAMTQAAPIRYEAFIRDDGRMLSRAELPDWTADTDLAFSLFEAGTTVTVRRHEGNWRAISSSKGAGDETLSVALVKLWLALQQDKLSVLSA